MSVGYIIFSVIAAIYAICYLVLAAKTGQFKKTVAVSVSSGLGSFALLGLIAPLTEIWLPFNVWTLGSAAAVGLPGVVAMLLANLIFI